MPNIDTQIKDAARIIRDYNLSISDWHMLKDVIQSAYNAGYVLSKHEVEEWTEIRDVLQN